MNNHLSSTNWTCAMPRSPGAPAGLSSSVGRRSGFTLIEMMVVILLIVLMTSILVPVLSSASDVRRAREGARVLSTMLNSAQMQAQVSGRSAGVWIQRLKSSAGAATNSAAAMDLFLCEVPPPYLGDSLTSTASVGTLGPNSVTFNSSNLSGANVQPGDLIRFSYRGELYYLNNGAGGTWTITPLDQSLTGTQSFPPGGTLPFQIYRRPIKSLASAVQLTEGVAVDLNFSGVDVNSSANNFNTSFAPASSTSDAGQIIVTFSPTGALDLVYIVPSGSTQTQVVRPISGVYLLVGKVEKIPPQAQSAQNQYPANWQDLDCRWVAAGRQTGLITTAEVASAPSGTTANVITSLRLARGGQNAGGN